MSSSGKHPRAQDASFDASYVSVDEDADRWLVGFADAQFGDRRHLILQRDKSPDPEDIELGLEGYHVELDDESRTCYGGIEAFELYRDHARVTFEDDAAHVLGDDKVLVVRFALRERQLAQLRGSLARIFDGDGCYLDLCS